MLQRIRATSGDPRPTQPDYLALRVLVDELSARLARLEGPAGDVLDLSAATRPDRDLLPEHRSYVSIDLEEHYGSKETASEPVLPFDDGSFDLILFTEGFHHAPDPEQGAAELYRVLRPGGALVLTVPLISEYDRRIIERRYTGPALGRLFDGWEEVEVAELGGYTVTWATLSGLILRGFGEYGPAPARRIGRVLLPVGSFVLNWIAALLVRAEHHWHSGPFALPVGLILTARRPALR